MENDDGVNKRLKTGIRRGDVVKYKDSVTGAGNNKGVYVPGHWAEKLAGTPAFLPGAPPANPKVIVKRCPFVNHAECPDVLIAIKMTKSYDEEELARSAGKTLVVDDDPDKRTVGNDQFLPIVEVLVANGGKEWHSNDRARHRVYFNKPETAALFGMMIGTRDMKTIERATRDGEEIPASSAEVYVKALERLFVYFDCGDGVFHVCGNVYVGDCIVGKLQALVDADDRNNNPEPPGTEPPSGPANAV